MAAEADEASIHALENKKSPALSQLPDEIIATVASSATSFAISPSMVASSLTATPESNQYVTPVAAPSGSTQMDFIKGFIAGQLVVVLLLWFLVRLVFLRNADEADAEMKRRMREKSKTKKKVGF